MKHEQSKSHYRPRTIVCLALVTAAVAVSPAGADAFGAVPETAAGSAAEAGLESFLGEAKFDIQPVFEGQRLPNVVVATDGTVLAVWGWGDVRVRRSEDGGETWGPEIPIRQGLNSGAAVVDENTGHILVFTEEHHFDERRNPAAPLHVYRSTDHGKTWTRQEVTIHPDEKGNVPTVCMNERGITLRHGKHAGRLLSPTRSYWPAYHDRSKWGEQYANAIYSDDGGRTWHTSAPFPALGTGEAALAELSDGRIYYNSRRHQSTDGLNPRRRHFAYSDDGGATWKDLSVSDVLPDGDQDRDYGLMAGLVRLPVRGRDILVFSNIESPKGRHSGTVWASFDGGTTWPVKRLVEKGSFAYSSLAAGRPGTPSEGWIFLLHEGSGGGRIARFNLAWLLQGEPTGDGELQTK